MPKVEQWRLCALVFSLVLAGDACAADFRCIDQNAITLGKVVRNELYRPGSSETPPLPWEEPVGPFQWQGESDWFCVRVAIEGKIASGDADKLEWLLTWPFKWKIPTVSGGGHPVYFELRSTGGSVLEALTLGRLLRTKHVSVQARRLKIEAEKTGKPPCGAPGQQICCASACALVYFGGAEWTPEDRLGLHRPTLEDLGEQDYDKAREKVEDVGTLIRQYFKEMEVDTSVFDTMMRAGPDEITVVLIQMKYPPSLRD